MSATGVDFALGEVTIEKQSVGHEVAVEASRARVNGVLCRGMLSSTGPSTRWLCKTVA